MDVIEAMSARYSVRDFKSDPVPKATLVKILEAATRCPSTGNSQSWQIFVAGGEVLNRIRQAYLERYEKNVAGKEEMPMTPPAQWPPALQARMGQIRIERFKLLGIDPQDNAAVRAYMKRGANLFGAPVLIVITMPRALSAFFVYDMGLLSQSILLAAQNYGIGSLIASGFISHPDILRRELGIPDDVIIIEGIALGYPGPHIINTYRSPRCSVSEAVTFKGI